MKPPEATAFYEDGADADVGRVADVIKHDIELGFHTIVLVHPETGKYIGHISNTGQAHWGVMVETVDPYVYNNDN